MQNRRYPYTRKDDTVREEYFGTVVPDPYRWLEDDRSEETADWVRRQNRFTEEVLAGVPFREKIRRRLEELYRYERRGIPVLNRGYLYFLRNEGSGGDFILCRQKDGEPGSGIEKVIDPTELSVGKKGSLLSFNFSGNERYMAFVTAYSGSDWSEIRVWDTEAGKLLPEVIRHVKFCEAVWSEDGFYYSRYDGPVGGDELTGANLFQKVYFHRVGTGQEEDALVYEDPSNPQRYYHPFAGPEERWLVIRCSEGTSGDSILYRREGSGEDFRTLFGGFHYDYRPVALEGDILYLHTNDGADTFRLVAVDLESKAVTELIPGEEDALTEINYGGGSFFTHYLRDASSRIVQYLPSGVPIREIVLPGRGTASGFVGRKNDRAVFYSYTDFTTPLSVYRLNPGSGSSEPFFRPETVFDPETYVTEQRFYESTDGVRVPMYLVRRKGVERNGRNPLLLYGYGGFNISLSPSFSPENLLFMENGGVYVLANIRGGGEYGERWHRAGMLGNKQQVFDDFIAAAEFLIAEGYTSPGRLAISGGSNGGLLVGACVIRRPELFAAAVPRVGVLDMLRFHKFTCGWGWIVEYGSPEEEVAFRYLLKYSPLHNVRAGVCYPPTLVMTADHDDRVVPAHSFKFAAALQDKQACGNPVLIRIEPDAGHGAGKPVEKIVPEMADYLTFICRYTGMSFDGPDGPAES